MQQGARHFVELQCSLCHTGRPGGGLYDHLAALPWTLSAEVVRLLDISAGFNDTDGSPEVRADVFVSYNGRPAARLVGPDTDLASIRHGPAAKHWLLPSP